MDPGSILVQFIGGLLVSQLISLKISLKLGKLGVKEVFSLELLLILLILPGLKLKFSYISYYFTFFRGFSAQPARLERGRKCQIVENNCIVRGDPYLRLWDAYFIWWNLRFSLVLYLVWLIYRVFFHLKILREISIQCPNISIFGNWQNSLLNGQFTV